jgi:hypothetical protein
MNFYCFCRLHLFIYFYYNVYLHLFTLGYCLFWFIVFFQIRLLAFDYTLCHDVKIYLLLTQLFLFVIVLRYINNLCTPVL